jgi:hypothetical protein
MRAGRGVPAHGRTGAPAYRRTGAPAHRRTFAALVLLLAALAPAARAQRSQWSDAVYVPGRWQAGRLVPVRTANQATDTLALVMRVDYFANPPRWRAEIRRTADGQNFGDPQVVLGDRATVQVVTALGATPLASHALNGDSLVRAALVVDASGRPQGAANGRVVDRAADGSVRRVVFRRTQRSATFDDAMLDPRNRSAGRNFLSSRVAAVGDQRSTAVVATAGARGVDRVQTPRGEVPVRPDSLAILRMERLVVGALTLEEFLRQGALGPYAVRPEVRP